MARHNTSDQQLLHFRDRRHDGREANRDEQPGGAVLDGPRLEGRRPLGILDAAALFAGRINFFDTVRGLHKSRLCGRLRQHAHRRKEQREREQAVPPGLYAENQRHRHAGGKGEKHQAALGAAHDARFAEVALCGAAAEGLLHAQLNA